MGRYDHVEKKTTHVFQIAVIVKAIAKNYQVSGETGRTLNIMNK